MKLRTHHGSAAFAIAAIALTIAPALSQPISPAAAAKPSTLSKPVVPGLAAPVGTLLAPRVVTKSVAFEGTTSDPTGITTCVENTGGSTASGVKIGTAFRYTDVLSGARRTNDHFLGAHVGLDVPAKGVVCRTGKLSDWQRELFRKCDVLDVQGGTRDANNNAFTHSMTIQPTCAGKIRLTDTFPRGVASAPIIKPPQFDISVTPPKGSVLPPPPPPPVK